MRKKLFKGFNFNLFLTNSQLQKENNQRKEGSMHLG